MIDLQKMANEIMSDFSWTSKSDGDPFRTIFRVLRDAYEQGRRDENIEIYAAVTGYHTPNAPLLCPMHGKPECACG